MKANLLVVGCTQASFGACSSWVTLPPCSLYLLDRFLDVVHFYAYHVDPLSVGVGLDGPFLLETTQGTVRC
jgi:hypothetical protein